jgi:hypothetical protein
MPKLKEGTPTVEELRKAASKLKIKGRSKMNKKELMEALKEDKTVVGEDDKDMGMEEFLNLSAAKVGLSGVSEKKKPAPKPVKREKRAESPTRIDKEKMKELKKTGRYKPGRGKFAAYERSPASRMR